jgi:hypothetical protein
MSNASEDIQPDFMHANNICMANNGFGAIPAAVELAQIHATRTARITRINAHAHEIVE